MAVVLPKYEALDSIRGVAAVVVMMSHLILGFYPVIYIGTDHVVTPWVRVWYQGDFAVTLFFVLSGFVLSLSFLHTKNIESLRSAAVRRYWRLVVPVAASVLISYLIHSCNIYANSEVSVRMGQNDSDWLGGFYAFRPSIVGAAKASFWGVFVGYRSAMSYNPVLWTMSYEFCGSLLLFAFLALFRTLRSRPLI